MPLPLNFEDGGCIYVNSLYWSIELPIVDTSIGSFNFKSVFEFYKYVKCIIMFIRENIPNFKFDGMFFDEYNNLININEIGNYFGSEIRYSYDYLRKKEDGKYINEYLLYQLVGNYLVNYILSDTLTLINYTVSAIYLQSIWRGYLVRKKTMNSKMKQEVNVLRDSNEKLHVPKLRIKKRRMEQGTENTTPRTETHLVSGF